MSRKKQPKRYRPAGLRKPLHDKEARKVAEIISYMTPRQLSDKSWISVSAARNLLSGKTNRPQNQTIAGLLHAAGYTRKIVKST